MTSRFNKAYREQQFIIRWWSVLVNPFFIIRFALYKNLKALAPNLKGKLLDFGCGAKPYRSLFSVDEYVGLDMENPGHPHDQEEIDVFYDGKTIPFEPNTFDSVLSSEVFEHVFNLDDILSEIHRVLKPGGKALFSTPFAWNEHEQPYDFGRYTSFGLSHILEKHGFRVLEIRKTTHFSQTLLQLSSLYVYQIFRSRNRYWNLLFTFVLIFPIHTIGSLLCLILPKQWDYYHNLVLLVEKNENRSSE